jgi:hypothetical protein
MSAMARTPSQQAVLVPADAFPQTTGYDVEDKPLIAPGVFLGKRTVLFLSFTIAAFPILETWEKYFQQKHGKNTDLRHYVMPVMAGFTTLLKNIATPNVIKNVPEKKFGSVLFAVYGDSVPIVKFLGCKDLNKAYTIILNERAQLQFHCSGEPDQDNRERFEKALKS